MKKKLLLAFALPFLYTPILSNSKLWVGLTAFLLCTLLFSLWKNKSFRNQIAIFFGLLFLVVVVEKTVFFILPDLQKPFLFLGFLITKTWLYAWIFLFFFSFITSICTWPIHFGDNTTVLQTTIIPLSTFHLKEEFVHKEKTLVTQPANPLSDKYFSEDLKKYDYPHDLLGCEAAVTINKETKKRKNKK